MANLSVPRLQYAVREVSRRLEQNDADRTSWDKMSEDCLWRELVACILGSRVRFDVAHAAMERMDTANLFLSVSRLSTPDEYERAVLHALWDSGICADTSGLRGRYPFPLVRAKQISAAASTVYANGRSIHHLLHEAEDACEVRRRLSAEVPGIGPKQASLFLRNVGYTAQVAVLDTHVLTYMNWVGLTPSPTKVVRTVRQYEMLEYVFMEHSWSAGFPPSLYDLAVWVVVRVAKKEFTACQ